MRVMLVIMSAEGETRRVIKDAECGICCDIGNADELALSIKNLI